MLKISAAIMVFMTCCLFVALQAQQKIDMPPSTSELACQDCHACKEPTVENPCLRMCPRHWKGKDEGQKLTKGPDVIILKELENQYEPVKFSHKEHAYWADLGESCVTCHHYTPTDASHPPCRECHGPKAVRANIEPNLKGAYHQQCMGCHIQWSEDTNCEVCHALKAEKHIDKSKVALPTYRDAQTPDKVVYNTSMDDGPFVTFFHENHSAMYGLSCTNCHKDQPCISCHYQKEKPASMGGFFDGDVHAACAPCHKAEVEETCDKCHSTTEKKEGFDHGKATGWPLNIYHQKLSCQSCHPAGKPYGKLNRSCKNCHSNWNNENFDHAIAGIELDENHIEIDCADCHINRQFEKKSDCSNCHDDKKYPEDKPGKVTKKSR